MAQVKVNTFPYVSIAQLRGGGGVLLALHSQSDTDVDTRVQEGVLKTWILEDVNNEVVVLDTENDLPTAATADQNTAYFVKAMTGGGRGLFVLDEDTTTMVDFLASFVQSINTQSPVSGDGSSGDPITIEDDAINLNHLAGSSPDLLLGYDGAGNPTEVALGAGLSLSGAVLSLDGGGSGAAIIEYSAGNGVRVRATAAASSISTTLSNGILTITLPSGATLLSATIDVNANDATFSDDVATGSFKVLIDNSANNSGTPSGRNPIVKKRTSSGAVTSSNPLVADFTLNSDIETHDFAAGIYSFVVQALATRASSGALIVI